MQWINLIHLWLISFLQNPPEQTLWDLFVMDPGCKMKKKTRIIAKLSFSLYIYIEHKCVTLWSWAKCGNSTENALLNVRDISVSAGPIKWIFHPWLSFLALPCLCFSNQCSPVSRHLVHLELKVENSNYIDGQERDCTSWTFLTSLSSPTGVVNAANWAAALPSVLSPLTLQEEHMVVIHIILTHRFLIL